MDELYEIDIVYKELVDNYTRASIELDKARANRKDRIDNVKIEKLSNNLTKSLNALSKYKDNIRHNNLVQLIEQMNFTTEDIAIMFEKRIIPVEILAKMIGFKKGE